MKYKYSILLFYLLLYISPLAQAQMEKISFAPTPEWVAPVAFSSDTAKKSDYSLLRLLYDTQLNAETEEYYYRFVYQIHSVGGISRLSSFNIEFDPQIHTIQIHNIIVHRNEEKIDILSGIHTDIQIVKKYIGGQDYTQTGVLKLYFDDLVIGDIVELSYTRIGKQPDLYEKFACQATMDVGAHTLARNFRVIFDPERPLHYYKHPQLPEPEVSKYEYGTSWQWNVAGEKAADDYWDDDYYPSWASSDRYLYVHDFQSIQDLQNYYRRHYNLKEAPSPLIQSTVQELTDTIPAVEAKINKIFAYVQQNIKYLAYGYNVPTAPDTVIQQRFGDCKSMSFLTCKMLKAIDVEAYPFIVNINGINMDLVTMPSPYLMDHCIVEFKLDNQYYYFDPTIDYQGGKATEKYHYNYRKGISLREPISDFEDLPRPNQEARVVRDILLIDPISEETQVKRVSFFKGHEADRIRNWAQKGDEEYVLRLIKNRFDWMYDVYADTIFNQRYIDKNLTSDENTIIVATELTLPDIISSGPISGNEYIDLSYLHDDLPQASKDSLKYYALPFPNNIRHEVVVLGVEADKIEQTPYQVETDYLSFSKTVTPIEGGLKFVFEITTFDDYFEGQFHKEYREALKKIRENCKIIILKEVSKEMEDE